MKVELDLVRQQRTIEKLRSGEIVDKDSPVRFPEDYSPLEILLDVVRGKVRLPPWQMKALIAALPFCSPKLEARAEIKADANLADRLAKALEAKRKLDADIKAGRPLKYNSREAIEFNRRI